MAKQPAATKSLLEIQQEEAQQMKQRKEQQQQQAAVTQQNRTQNRVVSTGKFELFYYLHIQSSPKVFSFCYEMKMF